jgi:SAM-dependent methyltransferase
MENSQVNIAGAGASRSAEAYWRPGELEEVDICPGCGAVSADVEHENLLDHLQGVPGRWNFIRCGHCASLFLSPRPTRNAFGKAYAEGYFTHESGSARNAADNGASFSWMLSNGYLNSRYGCDRRPATAAGRWLIPLLLPVKQQLDYFYRHLPKTPGTLLDVGCGNGAFLLRAAEAGWKVQGVEPDPLAAAQASSSGLRVHRGGIESFSARAEFDVITLSHVLEHLHEPGTALSACRRMLRPGGQLWMALPNVEGLGHRVYKSAWFPLEPPRHLFLPSMRELERLCRDAGFQRVSFLRRGRTGPGIFRESASRATLLGVNPGPEWFWRFITNLASIVDPRVGEEFVVIARED